VEAILVIQSQPLYLLMKTLSALFATLLVSAVSLNAAVTIGNVSTSLLNTTDSTTFSHTLALESNLLVVTIAGENGVNPSVSDVSFGGQSLTPGPFYNSNPGKSFAEVAQVWYLLNPASTGAQDIVVTTSNLESSSNWGLDYVAMDFGNIASFISFDGTASQDNAGSYTLSFDTSSIAPGRVLLVGAAERNENGGSAPSPTVGITTYSANTSASHGTGAGYLIVDESAATTDWEWTWGSQDYAIAGAAFAVIPEPSTYAMVLAGLVMVGFCLRRRR